MKISEDLICLIEHFVSYMISNRKHGGFNFDEFSLNVYTNSPELRWVVHYKFNTLRFTSIIEPGEGDYVTDSIYNHIRHIDSAKGHDTNVAQS